MLKSFLLFILMAFVVAPGAATADDPLWQEGAVLSMWYSHNVVDVDLSITAVKTTDAVDPNRPVEVSEVTLRLYATGYDPNVTPVPRGIRHDIGPITVPIPGDPDNLEISRDLGWAGVDTVVQVWDRATNSYVPVEIHVNWWANTGVSAANDIYQRGARVTGYVITPVGFFRIGSPYSIEANHIFADRLPSPYYG